MTTAPSGSPTASPSFVPTIYIPTQSPTLLPDASQSNGRGGFSATAIAVVIGIVAFCVVIVAAMAKLRNLAASFEMDEEEVIRVNYACFSSSPFISSFVCFLGLEKQEGKFDSPPAKETKWNIYFAFLAKVGWDYSASDWKA
jgi:hypothetical protein